MSTIIRSGRFYFWPIIAANIVSMTLAVGGDPMRAAKFSIVISCLASFGFILNDLWDRKVDSVNKARHFENSNATVIGVGIVVGIVFLITGLVYAYFLGQPEFITAVSIALALGAYSILLRRLMLIPTIVAAAVATSPLWTPLVLWSKDIDIWKYSFITAMILMMAAREIFMDARDLLGDIAGDRDTLATVFGARIAKSVGVTLTISATVPLVITIVFRSLGLPVATKLGIVVVAGIILYLLVSPALGTLQTNQSDRTAIQKYVRYSRVSMALVPLLILILWWL